jgi:hypothetical protein
MRETLRFGITCGATEGNESPGSWSIAAVS